MLNYLLFLRNFWEFSEKFSFRWGLNTRGQLGHGDTEFRPNPTIVNSIGKFVHKIIASGDQSIALTGNFQKNFPYFLNYWKILILLTLNLSIILSV